MEHEKTQEKRTLISNKVRTLREGRHWTQAELAKRLGISQGWLSTIERGQGSFTAEQFLDMCILMGCDYCPKIPGVGPVMARQLRALLSTPAPAEWP